MKDKRFILSEIRRTASLNGEKPLGQVAFRNETGIAEHEWRGVYWARWGDALSEAGFDPLEWNQPSDGDQILEALATLVRKYGRFPTSSEISIEKRQNSFVPTHQTILRRLGTKADAVRKVRIYCESHEDFTDVFTILYEKSPMTESLAENNTEQSKTATKSLTTSGYVYLVKSGTRYKIGCSENHWRRKGELHKQTSEGISEIHTIAAIDDPAGIEKYWHERFKDKRLHGEWFDLSAEDVSAFKKRKFM
jgi:hypothetical protein